MSAKRDDSPPVTVLMAVYNGEEFLREAIDSILAQTFREFEFVIVNDASTDSTSAIIGSYRDPRIRIIANPENLGLTRSLNIGLATARGMLVARQDADDVSHRRRLEKLVHFLETHPDIVVVGSRVRPIGESRWSLNFFWPRCTSPLAIRFQLLFESPFAHSATMFRHSIVWGEFGGYDENYRTNQDFELWSRIGRKYSMTNLPDQLLNLRSRRSSVSSKYSLEAIERVRSTLRENFRYFLDQDDYENWFSFWLSANNPATFGEALNLGTFLEDLRRIQSRFLLLHPEARNEREIKMQMGRSLSRVACTIARQNRLTALTTFFHAARLDPIVLIRALPWLIRNLIRRRHNRKTESGSESALPPRSRGEVTHRS